MCVQEHNRHEKERCLPKRLTYCKRKTEFLISKTTFGDKGISKGGSSSLSRTQQDPLKKEA